MQCTAGDDFPGDPSYNAALLSSLPQIELHRGPLTIGQDDGKRVYTRLDAILCVNSDREQLASIASNEGGNARDVTDDPWSAVEVRANDLDDHGPTDPRRANDVSSLRADNGKTHRGGRRRGGLVGSRCCFGCGYDARSRAGDGE